MKLFFKLSISMIFLLTPFLITGTAQATDTIPPTVSITSPTSGATVTSTLSINATASDNTSVTKVEFYVNGVLYGTDFSSPYSYLWYTQTFNNGNYTLAAKAFDAANNMTASSPVTVTVSNGSDAASPTVNITSPTSGATVSSTLSVNVTATDDAGVIYTSLFVDGVYVISNSSAPFSPLNWNTAQSTNGNHTLVAKAYDFSGHEGVSAPVTVTVNNADVTPPTVNITAPAQGATVSGSLNITSVSADNTAVVMVEFYIDGTLKAAVPGTNLSYPVSYPWNTTLYTNGSHSIVVKSYDAANNMGSATRTVTVNNFVDTTPPTASITSPTSGATVTSTLSINATATDNVGIYEVDFYVDGVYKGWDSSFPYSYSWNTLQSTNGSHTLIAKAYDTNYNMGASAPITVTVNNIDTTPPTVSITSPTSGATVTSTLSINATASDNVSVARVEFYVDNVLKGNDTSSPYSYNWNTMQHSDGSHTLTAKAFDAANNMGASAPITVTVDQDNPPTEIWSYNLPNKSFGEKVKALDYGYSDFHSQEAPTKVIVGSERGGVSIPTVISAVYSLDIKDGHMLWSRTFGTTATSGTSGVSVASRKLLNVMSVQDKNADNSSDVYAVFSNYNSSTGKTTQYRFMLDGTTGADLWHDTGMFNGIAPEFVFEGNNNNQPLTTADIDGDGMTDTVESPIPGVVHASY